MLKFPRPWRLALILCAFAGLCSAAQAEVVEEIVAVVNGDVVTKSELAAEEEVMTAEVYKQFTGAELDKKVEEIGEALLIQMIDNRMLLHKAEAVYDLDLLKKNLTQQYMGFYEIESEQVLIEMLERDGMTGPERGLLYQLAVESGLRAGELRSLTRSSFDLDGDPPTVTVAAAYSKRRREDVLPIRPDLANDLGAFMVTLASATQVFKMPKKDKVIDMLKADLELAGIPYRDDAGKVSDFHALRHSFISNLAAGGVHPKTAQALARHSTITLTMDRYSHSYHGEQSAALEVLPDLSRPTRESVRATGTDDAQPTEKTWRFTWRKRVSARRSGRRR